MSKTLLILSCLMSTMVSYAKESDAILGEWLTAEGKSKVSIVHCGEKYCGKIVWLKEPTYPADDEDGMAGKTKVDRENKDESLRSQPIIGLEILKGFQYAGDKEWEDGTIYDPQNGKTYACILSLKRPGLLHVRGYIGFSFIGRTTEWTR